MDFKRNERKEFKTKTLKYFLDKIGEEKEFTVSITVFKKNGKKAFFGKHFTNRCPELYLDAVIDNCVLFSATEGDMKMERYKLTAVWKEKSE